MILFFQKYEKIIRNNRRISLFFFIVLLLRCHLVDSEVEIKSNLLIDSSFEKIGGKMEKNEKRWIPLLNGFFFSSQFAHSGSNSLKIYNGNGIHGAFQRIDDAKLDSDRFLTVSSWFSTENSGISTQNREKLAGIYVLVNYSDGTHSSHLMELKNEPSDTKNSTESEEKAMKNEWKHRCMVIRREGGSFITSATVAVMSGSGKEKREENYVMIDDVELHPGSNPNIYGSKCNVESVPSSLSNGFAPPRVRTFGYPSESNEKNETFGIATVLRNSKDFEQLRRLLEVWKGPVSAAVAMYDPNSQVKELDLLRLKYKEIEERVDFHFVYFNLIDNYFPVNFMRNVAFQNSLTPLVLHLDINFLPHPKTHENLMRDKEIFEQRMQKSVFVVPAVKTNEKTEYKVEDKRDLSKFVPKEGQEELNWERWLSSQEIYRINPSFVKGFAPILITSKSVPGYDPRFNEENGHGKESFCGELNLAGYQFLVLPNVWVASEENLSPHNTNGTKMGRGEHFSWMEYYDFVAEKVSLYGYNNPLLYLNTVSAENGRIDQVDPLLLIFIGVGVLVMWIGFKQAMKSPLFSTSRTALLPLHHKDT
eukprot:TRINITY_DN1959_c0_g1_i1.p1 TRINITY_DN1959_c0_g1~~TRINITY_DN1959_c0_g1_i1.p1  ORF type:complete len:591 (-),score=200.87 TRINITY_DN1959_c0_g1_i1:1007-2779(-)